MIVFPTAYPSLDLIGDFRTLPEDFIVNEHLGFEPNGDGEHVLICIEKIGQNTHWVAEQLALLLDLDKKAIGYCGRKDRHAITQQWLSIYDPHRRVDFSSESASSSYKPIDIEGVTVLKATRHSHKLRPGDHQSNRFCIRLRNVRQTGIENVHGEGDGLLLKESQKPQLIDEIKQRLSAGVPNYFGAQRFGRDGNNLTSAASWFEKKQMPPRRQKSMVMSAARSYVFNTVLAARVKQGCWAHAIEGDVMIGNIPTAPLWGRGRLATSEQALLLEETALSGLTSWCHGLEHCGLNQERRPMVLVPTNGEFTSSVEFDENDLVLKFELTSGAFATAVLAEIAILRAS